jgi:penicillin-binding protein 1C
MHLRIQGLEAGAVLRPVPGQRQVHVAVSAQGSGSAPLYWLVDGVQQRRAGASAGVTLQLDRAGAHSLTVLDDAGRFARVGFSVSGL